MTPQRRRLHLIDKHLYPKNYFFAVTKEGIDGRNSLLLEPGHRQRKHPTNSQSKGSQKRDKPNPSSDKKGEVGRTPSTAWEAANSRPSGSPPSDRDTQLPKREGDQMEGLTGAMSALKFIPPNIRFGRGGGGTGFSKK